MATKNIKLKDQDGNYLLPETLGSLVTNNSGDNLGGVEAGAQVNVIEGITVDGDAITVTNKIAAITLPTAAEYTITKATTADTGYLATYQLFKDSVAVGDKIQIPKDFLVKSATLEVCETADTPVEGMEVGDPYLDFVINTKGSAEAETDAHIYIPVKDLVDVYTAGDGLDLANNQFSVDTTDSAIQGAIAENSTKFVQSGAIYTALAGKVDANAAITAGTKCKITYDAKGLVTAGADLAESDIPSLHLSKVTDVTATAAEVNVLDGIEASTAELNILKGVTATATEINVLDGITASTTELNYVDGVTSAIQTQIDGKVAKNDDITGAQKCKITYDAKGLVTAGTDLEATDIPALDSAKITTLGSYAKGSSSAAIATTDTLNAALGKLECQIDTKQATITGAATSIVSNDLTASKVLVSNSSGKVAASGMDASKLITWEEISA